MTDRGAGWDELAVALAADLPSGIHGDAVILKWGGDDGYFVQFLQLEDRLRMEAKSNHYLPSKRHLDPRSELLMRELGWQTPDTSPTADNANWRIDTGWPMRTAVYMHLADIAVKTLSTVYGVDAPGLRYRTVNVLNGDSRRMPALEKIGLERDLED